MWTFFFFSFSVTRTAVGYTGRGATRAILWPEVARGAARDCEIVSILLSGASRHAWGTSQGRRRAARPNREERLTRDVDEDGADCRQLLVDAEVLEFRAWLADAEIALMAAFCLSTRHREVATRKIRALMGKGGIRRGGDGEGDSKKQKWDPKR